MIRILSALLVLFGATGAIHSQCLTLVTQNALHMGWNDPGPSANKIAALTTMQGNAAPPSLVMYQEVMNATPHFANYRVGAAKGSSSNYLERYGFTVATSSAFTVAAGVWEYENLPVHTASGALSRPPTGLAASCATSAGEVVIWFLSFHAIYGDYAWQRHGEATAIATVVRDYFACRPDFGSGTCSTTAAVARHVIVGGDWNLSRNQVNNDTCVPLQSAGYTCTVWVNDKTSLNRQTAAWSKRYDHFVVVTAPGQVAPTITGAGRILFSSYGVAGAAAFVQKVSDHIGVVSSVTP